MDRIRNPNHHIQPSSVSVLQAGRNCWRVELASRAAFLIDGEAYFRAFREAVSQARRSVLILGWDFDTRVLLVRDGVQDDFPVRLGAFLVGVLARQRQLQIHVLMWDFHAIYAFEREWWSRYKLGWHPRFHFQMDDDHPAMGCHHQKVVVIDDALAFVGGLDLTKCRWDTPEHRADDPRRQDAEEASCPPFHDVQMVVEGPAAATLGTLARERWFRATGQRIAPPAEDFPSRWPSSVKADLVQTPVAIARTEPGHQGRPGVREVERLLLDAIKSARRLLYIETQYLTSTVIAQALAARLDEPDGPEIIVVLHPNSSGWLEQQTMDVLRARLLAGLRKTDRYGRLGLYCPYVPYPNDRCLSVHSKVLIVDDELVRIGSANLSNRSMGLDTECDLAVEAQDDPDRRQAIARFRHRLLAEHLGTAPETVAARFAAAPSALSAIQTFSTGERTLRTYDLPMPPDTEAWLPNAALIDPDRPIDADLMTEQILPREARKPARRQVVIRASILLGLVALAAAWRWTPLGEWVELAKLLEMAERFRNSPVAPGYVIGGFLLGGLAVVPVTLLIGATVLAFGPMQGFLYSFLGMTASALLLYGLGRVLGRETVRRLAGPRIQRLGAQLARRGLLTVIAVRVLPIAPFTIVNLIVGASPIGLRDFFLGTIIGELPGLVAIALFLDKLETTIRHPGLASYAVLVVLAGAIIVGTALLRRWLGKKTAPVAH